MTSCNSIQPELEHKKKKKSLTVMDYLKAEEVEQESTSIVDHKDSDELPTLQCITPRHIVTRWIKKLRHSNKKTNQPSSSSAPKNTIQHVVETPPQGVGDGAGGRGEEMESFKVGAGIGLALVVAASKNELDKMMELRKQMESIVKSAKEESRCKSADCNLGQVATSYSLTNVDESINSNWGVSDPSSPYVGIKGKESGYYEINDKEWCRGEGSEERCVLNGMSQLESELEAELKLLEIQLDSAEMSRYNQDIIEESSDVGCETLDYDEEVDYANDPIDNFSEAHYGSVPPQELERRLHELLEAQQLERIKELETALKRTKQKLRKKEVEVCWWKDTAHLISRHVSKTAPLTVPSLKDQTNENFR